MCFILNMLCISSLYRSLKDNLGLRCGNLISACAIYCSSCLATWSWKFKLVLLRWAPLSFFVINNVLVVGDLTQSWYLIPGISFAPLF